MEHSNEDCLHCQINELIGKYLQTHEVIDATQIVAHMAESLADLILLSTPVDMQGKMLAHTIQQLGTMVLQKAPETDETAH